MTDDIRKILTKDAEDSLLYCDTLADFELKQEGEEEGEFTGYAAKYNNVDLGGDLIMRGAFDATVKKRGTQIKLLYQHRPSEPIGVITRINSDTRGLKITGKLLLSITQGRDTYELMKAGALDAMSIGYTLQEKDVSFKDGVRMLKRVDVREVSVVTFPMNERARITMVKSEALREDDFVNLFEENGILHGQDAIIAAQAAVKALEKPDGEASASEWEALKRLSESLTTS